MGTCSGAERAVIVFWLTLLMLTALAFVVSWAAAARVVRASFAAVREINALRDEYRKSHGG